MSYSVKEIFYTLQGEGANAGRPAVFCRFSGCNLWSGREADRSRAVCQFCDTDFLSTTGANGGKYASAHTLALAIEQQWMPTQQQARRFVVLTGGEPALQADSALLHALKQKGFYVAIETNGTRPLLGPIDWICVSPKANTELVVLAGDELKLVFPQEGLPPSDLADLGFGRFYLQPMDGPDRERNTRLAIEYCLDDPRWSLSIQAHKMLGIP